MFHKTLTDEIVTDANNKISTSCAYDKQPETYVTKSDNLSSDTWATKTLTTEDILTQAPQNRENGLQTMMHMKKPQCINAESACRTGSCKVSISGQTKISRRYQLQHKLTYK